MNRGSLAWLASGWLRSGGFNEAPIHESGKCGAISVTSRWFDGFNEAPIHESGKYEQNYGALRRDIELQ